MGDDMDEGGRNQQGSTGRDSLIPPWAWWLWAAILVGSFVGSMRFTDAGSSRVLLIAPSPIDLSAQPSVMSAGEVVAPQAQPASDGACDKRCLKLMAGYYEASAKALYPIMSVHP